MDYGRMERDLETIEWVIWQLNELRGTEWEEEAEPLKRLMTKEAERLRGLLAEEAELQREALCREYERNAL